MRAAREGWAIFLVGVVGMGVGKALEEERFTQGIIVGDQRYAPHGSQTISTTSLDFLSVVMRKSFIHYCVRSSRQFPQLQEEAMVSSSNK